MSTEEVEDDDADPTLRLADALTELAQVLLTDRDLKHDLQRVVSLACRVVPKCSGASVSMLASGQPTTVATTDTVTLELDVIQYDNSDGPCIAALGGQIVRIGFVDTDERFPHFAAGAADTRVKSVLSTPAIDHGMIVGSLNLYSQEPHAFDDSDTASTQVFAAEVANAIVKSATMRRVQGSLEDLQRDRDETTLVSRAQGVLMAIQDCSAVQARNLIANASRENGESLLRTAERILASARTSEPTLPVAET